MTVDIIVLSVYLAALFAMGAIFSKFNTNLSDYVRGGAKATWWMVGASNTIAIVSAFTFTGNAAMTFNAGLSVVFVYSANILGFMMGWLILARWFRQTRAYTTADIIRERYGVVAEQFNVYLSVLTNPFTSAIQLWALATFAAATFQFPLIPTIIVIGIVVVFYSTAGGRWAVMATDFVQNLLIFGITLLVAVLALVKIGGVGAFLDYFSDPRFAEDFRLVKEPGQFKGSEFSLRWAVMIFFMTFYYQISFTSASRYLSVKDGREGSRSALFAMVLTAIGSAAWIIPPMIARFLYQDEILALPLENPEEASYTYLAQQLLPNGLMGIMIAAMFAATMSSMDTGLNGLTGIVAKNLLPGLRRALGRPELTDAQELRTCKIVTVCLGVIIISYSVLFASNPDVQLFEAYFILGSVIGIPMGFPLLVGLWLRRLTWWTYFPIFGFCILPSIYSFIDERFFGNTWTYDKRALWVFAFGIIGTLIVRPLWKLSSDESREKVKSFFRTMDTPVDFAKEIGDSIDYRQAVVIGKIVTITGMAIVLLLLVPNELAGRFQIALLGAFFITIGLLMRWAASKEKQKDLKATAAAKSDPEE